MVGYDHSFDISHCSFYDALRKTYARELTSEEIARNREAYEIRKIREGVVQATFQAWLKNQSDELNTQFASELWPFQRITEKEQKKRVQEYCMKQLKDGVFCERSFIIGKILQCHSGTRIPNRSD